MVVEDELGRLELKFRVEDWSTVVVVAFEEVRVVGVDVDFELGREQTGEGVPAQAPKEL